MNQIRSVLAVAATLVAFSSPAGACSCVHTVPGFLTSAKVRLPANAIGVPWAGRVPDVDWERGTPDSSHFRIEIEEKGSWRIVPAMVQPIPAEVSGQRTMHGDPPVVLVGPLGGLQPWARYRFSSLIDAQNSVVFASISEESLHVANRNASAIVDPVVRRTDVAGTNSGSCETYFHAASTSIRIVLPPELEQWADAMLYVVRDETRNVWRPDSSQCDRTPPGRNALGLGQERLFSYCSLPREGPHKNTPGTIRGDTGPPEQRLPQGALTLEFVAWLPGTKERIAASAAVSLDCEDPGQ